MASSDASGYLRIFTTLLPVIIGIVSIAVNIVWGAIAVSMAKKRGLKTTPAFFAGLFGSFVALFFIAMFPVQAGSVWDS